MLRLLTAFQSRVIREEKGAAMVEYGLLLALIAVVAIAAITLVGGAVRDNFTSVSSAL